MKKIKKIVFFAVITMCLVLTATVAEAASSGTVTCNHSWSLADKTGYSCTGYTYVYSCSKCLATRKETTQATQDHNWYVTFRQEADCEKKGGLQAFCQICMKTKSETINPLGHSYTYASNNDATCTRDGTQIRRCQRCGDTDILPDIGSAKGHKFSAEWYVVEESTCLKKGVKKQVCEVCGAGLFREDDKFGPHKDEDSDRKCDLCGESLSIFTPILPDGDDGDDSYDCSCNCHKGGIKGFFWKIGNFFYKLFRIKSKQVCDCGAYHF